MSNPILNPNLIPYPTFIPIPSHTPNSVATSADLLFTIVCLNFRSSYITCSLSRALLIFCIILRNINTQRMRSVLQGSIA